MKHSIKRHWPMFVAISTMFAAAYFAHGPMPQMDTTSFAAQLQTNTTHKEYNQEQVVNGTLFRGGQSHFFQCPKGFGNIPIASEVDSKNMFIWGYVSSGREVVNAMIKRNPVFDGVYYFSSEARQKARNDGVRIPSKLSTSLPRNGTWIGLFVDRDLHFSCEKGLQIIEEKEEEMVCPICSAPPNPECKLAKPCSCDFICPEEEEEDDLLGCPICAPPPNPECRLKKPCSCEYSCPEEVEDDLVCPPCSPPPHSGCKGTGPCGCGPYECPDIRPKEEDYSSCLPCIPPPNSECRGMGPCGCGPYECPLP